MGRPRIYTLDENYFDSIDNPNKAYIIGFIYADGSINLKRNLLTICISEKDLEILEFIKKELNYSGIISSKKIKKNNYISLNITSKKLISKLQNIGVIQNKTYESKNLPMIPKLYYNDMIRGIFDGDGGIHRGDLRSYVVSFSSNIFILKELKKYFENLNINFGKIRLRNKNSIYSGMMETKKIDNLEKIFNFLYSNPNIFFLQRKYNKFLEYYKMRETINIHYSDDMIKEVVKLYNNKERQFEIAIKLNIPSSSVRGIIQRARKRNLCK